MRDEIWILLDSRGFGGIETHVVELAHGLAEAGWRPRVLLLEDHGAHPLSAALAPLPCEALPGGLWALWRRLRAGQPRLLHTHGYKANLLGRFAALALRIPVAASFHAGERPPGRVALYDGLDRWTSLLGRRIAVSRPIAARLPWGATVVPNFLALPPPPTGERPLCVAFVGRLSHEKGPDLFAALSQAAPGPRYEVFGDGPLRAACEAAAPGVVFHGARSGMAGAWEGIGLLAITSRAEGLPLAALEAMAHGVPVVAFAVGGLPDLLRCGTDGWLVTPGDVGGMAQRVRQWAAMTPGERARMGIAARTRVATEHGRPAGIARMLAAYGLTG